MSWLIDMRAKLTEPTLTNVYWKLIYHIISYQYQQGGNKEKRKWSHKGQNKGWASFRNFPGGPRKREPFSLKKCDTYQIPATY